MQRAGNKQHIRASRSASHAMFLTAFAIATALITHPPDDSDALLLLDHKDLHVTSPSRGPNFECHLQWDEKRCAFCPPVFQWGIGQYARCNVHNLE